MLNACFRKKGLQIITGVCICFICRQHFKMDSKEVSSGTMIEYPEIETVTDEKDKTQKPKQGFGKRRFSKLAAKVITKIYESPDGDEEAGKEGETDNTDNKESPPSSTNQQNIKKGEASQKKSQLTAINKLPKNRNSFASLVRLAKYKRMVTKTPTPDKPAEQPVELPRKARFSATMSPEAQYAMLKGYEDLLLNTLKTAPKSEQPQEGHFVRVKTPHHSVVSVHLNGLEQASNSTSTESFTTDEEQQQQQSRNRLHVWDIKPAPYHGQMYKLVSKDDVSPANRRNEDTNKALLPRKSLPGNNDKLVPKDKQLLLTHRFQCAMDILDKVRESKGQVVTSPRRKQKTTTNPVDNYNSWSREWSREFKLEYTK